MADWTPDDIPWRDFDPTKVDPAVLKLVKAASLVEFNSGDYTAYLCNVFHDDLRFQKAARNWEREEVQHGRVLAMWAKLADPSFDFEASFKTFTEGYRLPIESCESVRGSRAAELIARCLVETGTHTYYSALADATEEPVLKSICRHIASDERAHYALFHRYLDRYQAMERMTLWRRIAVAFARVRETQDDELAYAYYAANVAGTGRPYRRNENARAYSSTALGFYRPKHRARIADMFFEAVGLSTARGPVKLLAAILRAALGLYVRSLRGAPA
jgi:rubrerythrin